MAQYEGGEEEASKINKGYKMNPGSKELDTPGNFAEGSPATNFLTDYYSQPTTELPGGGADAEEGAYSKGAVAEQADYSAINKEIQGSIKEAGKGAGAAIQPKGDALTPERKSKLKNDAQGNQDKQDRLTEHYGQIWKTW